MEDPSVEACCVMGMGLPSPFAILLLSEDARKRCADPDAQRAMEQSLFQRMREINSTLDPHERVSMIVIADGPWTISNGVVTPTLKIKRAIVEERYSAFIDGWRSQNSSVVWETPPTGHAGYGVVGATSGARESETPPSQR